MLWPGSDFYRAGGATVVSPALQRGEEGQNQPLSPIGAAQTAKLPSGYRSCDCPAIKKEIPDTIEGNFV